MTDPIMGKIGASGLSPRTASIFGGDFKPAGELSGAFRPWVQIDADELPRKAWSFQAGWMYRFFITVTDESGRRA
jgi:hypothetical protein